MQVAEEGTVAPAVVWETLPIELQVQVTLRLARLIAALWRRVAMSSPGKITERHRQRRAVVYVRQSSPGQLGATWSRRRGSMRCVSARSSWGGRLGRSRSLTRTRVARARRRRGDRGSRSWSPMSVWATLG